MIFKLAPIVSLAEDFYIPLYQVEIQWKADNQYN